MSEQQLNLKCAVKTCPAAPGDLAIYNLQDALYFNGTPLSVLAQCPTGYYCPPGLFPRVFTYPPGTFTVYVPPDTGFPIVLTCQGCESALNTVLPSGSSQAAIQAASDVLISEAAAQQARCDAITSLPPGSKIPSTITLTDIEEYACVNVPFSASVFASATPSGAPYSLTVAPQPAWMVTAQNTTTLFLSGTPTTIGPVTFNVIATGTNASGTKSYTLNIIGIATASPLTGGQVGDPYSETLDASSIPGVLTWTVVGGTLPDGLSLNSATGEISGTPTLVQTTSFSIQASNGTQFCSKTFGLSVVDVPPFDCLGNPSSIQTAVWTQTALGAQPPCGVFTIVAGVGTFSIEKNTTTCVNNSVNIETTICNSGAPYDITINVPWDDLGNVLVFADHTIQVVLTVNGFTTYFDMKDLVSGPFTDFVVVGTIPTGAANNLLISVVLNCLPNPSISAFSLGDLTILPLTPP